MTGEQVFVSHAPADLGLAQELFSTVKNFPFGVNIALEEVESERNRGRLESRLANSDVVFPLLTARSVESRWVNQEIGYAFANGVPILPLYTDESLRDGFVSDVDGISIDRNDVTVTVFDIIRHLRAELAPLGSLSVPNWYIGFQCTFADCSQQVVLDLETAQSKLWKLHQHGKLLQTSCDVCGSTYYFDPATVGFVRRRDGR
jgi:hypothetical protein